MATYHEQNVECVRKFVEQNARLESVEKSIEVLPAIHERLASLEKWVATQNGTLQRVGQRVEEILRELSALAQHSRDYEEQTDKYRDAIAEAKKPSTKWGLIGRVIEKYPGFTFFALGLFFYWLVLSGNLEKLIVKLFS